ncbi:MAG TPA: amino acid ABC transporter permease [Nitrospiraceae bacterium]|nr:amino acid ABC transporter permease [Nitrospiraceae bacterium]
MGYELNFWALSGYVTLLLQGAGVTLALTAIASAVGLALSIGGAAMAHWSVRWARSSIALYVELIRNTPFLIQLFFIFFGLPSLGLRLTALQAAIIAMTINLTAYTIEILRAGIEAVPRGQREGGLALGVSPLTVFLFVILPQAIANVYPAVVSQIVITMLESAVVSQIAVADLTHIADYIQSRTYRAFETYFAITLIYLVMAICLRRALAQLGTYLFFSRPK